MKPKKLVLFVFTLAFAMAFAAVAALPLAAQDQQPLVTREINKAIVVEKFQELQQESLAIQRLDRKLRSLEFAPATEEERYWGAHQHVSTDH
jgi:hypothetical protein